MAPFDKLHTSSYWRSTVTFAISCIVSEIKWHIGRKSLFYRAMLSTAWTMPSQDVRPSVCHTLVFCRNGWKYILKLFTRSGSHTILVFPHQTVWKYSDRDPKRGRRMQKIWKKSRFLTNISLYLGNDKYYKNRAIVAMEDERKPYPIQIKLNQIKFNCFSGLYS